MATDPCFLGFEKWTSVAPKAKQNWGPDQFLDSTSARVIITWCILQTLAHFLSDPSSIIIRVSG